MYTGPELWYNVDSEGHLSQLLILCAPDKTVPEGSRRRELKVWL